MVNLLLINDNNRLPGNLPTMHQLRQFPDLIQPLERDRRNRHTMLRNRVEHTLALLRRTNQAPVDLDVPENNFRKRNDDLVRLRDLHGDPVHASAGAGDGRGVFVVRQHDRCVAAFAVGDVLDVFDDGVFAFAGIGDDVGTVLFGELEAFVAGVNADDFVAERFGELDAEMSERTRGQCSACTASVGM